MRISSLSWSRTRPGVVHNISYYSNPMLILLHSSKYSKFNDFSSQLGIFGLVWLCRKTMVVNAQSNIEIGGCSKQFLHFTRCNHDSVAKNSGPAIISGKSRIVTQQIRLQKLQLKLSWCSGALQCQ